MGVEVNAVVFSIDKARVAHPNVERRGDVVVTVPKDVWERWLAEGDAAGERETGQEYDFFLGGHEPDILPGDRVYVVCRGKLRGFAPLVRLEPTQRGFSLVRGGGAVAVTIDESVPGFRGFRYRWWDRAIEKPFPTWRTA